MRLKVIMPDGVFIGEVETMPGLRVLDLLNGKGDFLVLEGARREGDDGRPTALHLNKEQIFWVEELPPA